VGEEIEAPRWELRMVGLLPPSQGPLRALMVFSLFLFLW
jgi:hypothetical protein